jgi:hypothetical protein
MDNELREILQRTIEIKDSKIKKDRDNKSIKDIKDGVTVLRMIYPDYSVCSCPFFRTKQQEHRVFIRF